MTERALVLTLMVFFILLALVLFISLNQKRYSDTLYRIAFFDEVTGAPNLAKFKREATELIKQQGKNFFFIKLDIAR